MGYFDHIPAIRYEGTQSDNALAFRHYNPDLMLNGKSLAEHLRFSVCYWHSFCWPGSDIFGAGTFRRPWFDTTNSIDTARQKMDAAFDFMAKLRAPFWCFHDFDIAPEGGGLAASRANLHAMVDYAAGKMQTTGIRLLWGTANLFSHPRYVAGAATNPDPEVFAYAAAQLRDALEATRRLGGANYVMWGGREGYETLLNTDLKREYQQLGRMLTMVVEHKHKIGFKGPILLEPKPQEPTKHQYDYDTATIYGFLRDFGLEQEVKVNIEVNHATLAGHSFHHEVAMAQALGIFGSVDANRGDPQNGWDTDQFPNSADELLLPCYEIQRGGGFVTGGFNFDTKLRRQSLASEDLFHGHIGAMDVIALAWRKAAALVDDGSLQNFVTQRYENWNTGLGKAILAGEYSLATLADLALDQGLHPNPVSGRQECLENRINRVLHG